MPLTIEGERGKQEEAPKWLLLVPKSRKGPAKKGSWSGRGTLLLLESCNKNDGLGAPPPEQPQSKDQSDFIPHHSLQMNGLGG